MLCLYSFKYIEYVYALGNILNQLARMKKTFLWCWRAHVSGGALGSNGFEGAAVQIGGHVPTEVGPPRPRKRHTHSTKVVVAALVVAFERVHPLLTSRRRKLQGTTVYYLRQPRGR